MDPTDPNSRPADDAAADDADFWAAFDQAEEWAAVRPLPWYRRSARFFAALFVVAMIGTSVLVPWGELFDRLDNVQGYEEIQALADQAVAESPYDWLVTGVKVRDIVPSNVGGFVHGSPGDGIITVDLIGWDPQDLRSTVAHEIGHLLDFAAYGDSVERRDGLGSEIWAECAAVDAGFRRTDPGSSEQAYRCTRAELEQYRFSVSFLGEVCAPWNGECRTVAPIGAS